MTYEELWAAVCEIAERDVEEFEELIVSDILDSLAIVELAEALDLDMETFDAEKWGTVASLWEVYLECHS